MQNAFKDIGMENAMLRQHREIEDLKLQKTSAAFCGRGTLNFPCWGMAN